MKVTSLWWVRVVVCAAAAPAVGCGVATEHGGGDATDASFQAPKAEVNAAAAANWEDTVRERVESGAYQFFPRTRGFFADNLENGVSANFDPQGAHIQQRGSALEASLRLAEWGREGAWLSVSDTEPQLGECEQHPRLDAEGQCLRRVELRRQGVIEWWENRMNGLEQGFSIQQRPQGTGKVSLVLAVEGATAELAAGKQALIRLPDGSSLNYDELNVMDAVGRALEASLSLKDGKLAIHYDDTDAVYPVTVDPVVNSGWDVSDTGWFGGNGWPPNPIAPAGDINGDGYDDVIIGDWSYSAAGQESGRVFVYYGSATGLPKTASWFKDGAQQYNMFGFAVSTAGDVNGDGYADILIGEPLAGADTLVHRGGASIYTGSATGLPAASTAPYWRVDYDKNESWFGFSVACAGDVNGDNKSDIVIGAPYETLNRTEEGMMHVYVTGALGLPTTPSYSDYGGSDGINFGYYVSGVGDVNGDGLGDVVAAAPWWSASSSGKVWGYQGVQGGAVQPAGWSAQGTQVNQLFGNPSPAGDVNGDGLADFLISDGNYDTPNALDAGRAMLYKGVAGAFADAGTELTTGLNANEGVGARVNAVGDLNGDGYADVAVLGQTTPTQIFYGSTTEPAYSLYQAHSVAGTGDVNGDGSPDMMLGTGNDPSVPYHVIGFSGKPLTPTAPDAADFKSGSTNPTTDLYGQTLVGCDVNGDGYGDLLVGAPNLNDGLSGSGKVFMYKGSAAGLTTTATWPTTGQQSGAAWGTAIACADFNGDGYNDVAIGAPKYDNDQTDDGRVAIFHGGVNGLPAAPAVTLDSDQVGSLFGAALATGDVNGDGIADLIVSATAYDLVGKADQGRVFVYHGALNTGLTNSASLKLDGGVAGALFGSAIGVGDINRDGYEDLVVGAEGYTNGQSQEGRVVSFVGSATGLVSTIYGTWKPEADVAGAHLGKALTITDLNADGYADLIVSAPLYTNGNTNEGRIFTYQGSSTGFGAATSFLEGDKDNVKLGEHLASGDWNNDGKGDVLLGYSSFTPSGTTMLGGVYVQPSGEQVYHYEKTGWLELGLGVTFSADFNGDGLSDVAATHKLADGTQHVSIWENKAAKNTLIAVARRPGTTIAIPIGGKSPSRAFDVRMFARSPNGRTRAKLQVEAKLVGTPFNGLNLVTPATWTDTGTAGTALTTPVTGLSAAKAYHWRARVLFDPARGGATQTHSRWVYGGAAGLSQAAQVRTP